MKRECRCGSIRLALACLAVFGLAVASSAATVLEAKGNMAPCLGTDVSVPSAQDDSYTVEAWIKPDNVEDGLAICSQGGVASGSFMFRTYGGKLSVKILKYNGQGMTADFVGTANSDVAVNAWQHVACVRTPTAIRLYLNGVLDNTFVPSDAPGSPAKFPKIATATLQMFMVGGLYGTSFDTYADSSSRTYSGRMAEVRLWSVARSDAEIATNWNKRLKGNESGLRGYWPMSESSGRAFENYVTGIPAVVPAATCEVDAATVTNMTVVTDDALPLVVATRMSSGICFAWNTNATQKANLTGLADIAMTYNYVRAGDGFSYEAWIKIDPALTNAPGWSADFSGGIPFFQQYRANATGRMMGKFFNGGRLGISWISEGNVANYISTPTSLPVDKWVHLAIVLGSDGQFISIDGEPVSRASNPYDGLSQPDPTNTQDVRRQQMFCHFRVYMSMFEVRIWRRARTEAEVRAQRHCKFTGKERSLIYYNPCSQKTPGTSGWYWFNYVKDSPWVDESPAESYGSDLYAPSAFLYDDVPYRSSFVADSNTVFAAFNGTKFSTVRTGVNITTEDFTMEAWIFPRQFKNSGNYVFSQYADNAEGRMQFLFPAGKPRMSIDSADASLGTSGNLDCSGAVPTNAWTHVAAVRQGGTWTIYTNGLVAASGTGRSTCPLYTGGSFCIGWQGKVDTSSFNGQIRDVRVWRRARTQEEIAAYMHNALDGKHSSLVGYWPLDTDTGSVCTDAKTGAVGTMNVGWTPAAPLALGKPVYGDLCATIIVFR